MLKTLIYFETVSIVDGRVIKVGGERFEAAEALFQPHLVNVEGHGVAEMVFNAIQDNNLYIFMIASHNKGRVRFNYLSYFLFKCS